MLRVSFFKLYFVHYQLVEYYGMQTEVPPGYLIQVIQLFLILLAAVVLLLFLAHPALKDRLLKFTLGSSERIHYLKLIIS